MVKAIYSRDKKENGRLYIDGEELVAGLVGGNLSNWDATYKIMLGNEETVGSGRFWLGENPLCGDLRRGSYSGSSASSGHFSIR